MVVRSYLLLLLLLLLWVLPSAWAHGFPQPADAANEYALSTHAQNVATIERTLLALITIAPYDDRFDLYRTYNELLGAWVQVDGVHCVLDRAIVVAGTDEERATRSTLRDQAEFALEELDSAIVSLANIAGALQRPDDIAVNVAARDVLLRVHTTVARIRDIECARIGCTRIR